MLRRKVATIKRGVCGIMTSQLLTLFTTCLEFTLNAILRMQLFDWFDQQNVNFGSL